MDTLLEGNILNLKESQTFLVDGDENKACINGKVKEYKTSKKAQKRANKRPSLIKTF